MTRILITGALGQIGTELAEQLRDIFGKEEVISTDIKQPTDQLLEDGPYRVLDVTDLDQFEALVQEFDVDWIIHNASILSATGEKNPELALNVNARGVENALKIARDNNTRIFSPSSIAAFGESTPRDNTPDTTIMRPTTMYGITKVWNELLGEYFHNKWGVDFRSLRYPGIISYKTLPGGGTTDYAVEIYYKALQEGKYTCFLEPDSLLPMMYMPDCIQGTIDFISAEEDLLQQRVFNMAAFSFSPQEQVESIKKYLPNFEVTYKPDYRQNIADSWPNSLDDSAAREQWNWNPAYDLDAMTEDMLTKLSNKLNLPPVQVE